ncbi:ROK family protein [Promicromonospora sp. NPDC050880]|uniref:ROK family protein n=1 Tax=Promicromonospora sp. NPDC050880 TaxID=3364406 RepID=UPI00379F99D4
MTGAPTAGVDIGGTKIRAAVVTPGGEVLASATAPTPSGGAAMLDVSADLVARAAASAGVPVAAVGVGAAGVVDPGTGEVLAASDSFVGWVGTDLRSGLASRTGLPVTVANDVDAFLVGEATWGAVRGVRSAAGIALGTGVGGALWLDGGLYRGAGAAGEIGHMPGFGDAPCTCGQRGHLETLASGRSVERRYAELVSEGVGAAGVWPAGVSDEGVSDEGVAPAGRGSDGVGSDGVGSDGVGSDGVGLDGVGSDGRVLDGLGSGGLGSAEVGSADRGLDRRDQGLGERGGSGPVGAAEIEVRARAGDPVALRVHADAGHAVGSAVLVVAALLDVGHVVVGGGLARAWDLLEPALLARLREAPPVSGHRVEVRRAALGGDATVVGAAALARRPAS